MSLDDQTGPQTHGRVLIVDDDDAIRTMVERVLRREKFEVDSASDGFEAIEKLSRHDYGAVLLDLMMPRIDGHGVLSYLVAHSQPAAPAVLVMTANMGAESTIRSPAVRGVLAKPFDIQHLVSQVRACTTPARPEVE